MSYTVIGIKKNKIPIIKKSVYPVNRELCNFTVYVTVTSLYTITVMTPK